MTHSEHALSRRDFAGVLAGGAIGALAGLSSVSGAAEADDFFFIAAADPQLFWGPEAEWAKAAGHINRLKPAFAVVCGDLINRNGNAKAVDLDADEKMAHAYLKIARTVDKAIPLHNVAGNHDVCNVPTPASMAWYVKRFGKLWYSFEQRGCLFVVLQSDVLKNPGSAPGVAERQMTWLRETFEKASARKFRHKIVFMHHPMCLNKVDEKDAYFNMPRSRRDELLKLFHRHGVSAVFSGHYHRNVLVKDGDLELITTASSGKALGKDPLGMRIVRVYQDRIEHTYHAHEKLPERIEM